MSKITNKQIKKPIMQTNYTMSDDMALGLFDTDGSFYIGLAWQPTTKSRRLRCDPEWTISGDNEDFCQVFARIFDGTIKPVDDKGQLKFVLGGIGKCLKIIPFFENAPWMPHYKEEQFNRWKQALLLLEAQEHFTEEGIHKLLDLTYGYAEKGGRKYPKEQYLAWALAWLNDPSRQKRKPRGQTT